MSVEYFEINSEVSTLGCWYSKRNPNNFPDKSELVNGGEESQTSEMKRTWREPIHARKLHAQRFFAH